jgi:hypothetical protein
MQGGPGAGMPGGGMGGTNSEFTAKRSGSSTGAAGKWIIKDGDNELTLVIKADGSKLSGSLDNPSMGGAVEFNDGKLEGDKISFSYMRQNMKILWTGTLSGNEIKLKREVGGGMPGAGPTGN